MLCSFAFEICTFAHSSSILDERAMSSVRQRLVISFIVAWIAYALTYFLRKPLGVVRKRDGRLVQDFKEICDVDQDRFGT